MEINPDTNDPSCTEKIVYILRVKHIKYLIKYILLKIIRKINLFNPQYSHLKKVPIYPHRIFVTQHFFCLYLRFSASF